MRRRLDLRTAKFGSAPRKRGNWLFCTWRKAMWNPRTRTPSRIALHVFGAGVTAIGWLIVNPEQARSLASSHLAADLPQRWRHVQGVARRASQIAPSVTGSDDTLVCAAWLHDIGYAPAMAVTGFHPLDGARFLAATGVPRRVVGLVAHHSCAVLEADLRGLAAELADFDDEHGAVRDALWYCDITTSPEGEPVAATERIAEIKRRYGPGHLVTRFITLATPDLLTAVSRTEQLLDMP